MIPCAHKNLCGILDPSYRRRSFKTSTFAFKTSTFKTSTHFIDETMLSSSPLPVYQANHDCRPSCEAQGFGMTDHTIDLVALRPVRWDSVYCMVSTMRLMSHDIIHTNWNPHL